MADTDDNDFGIELKTWLAASESERNSYHVWVWPWNHERRVIERDGLVSLQVTICHEGPACWTCKDRVSEVNGVLTNVPCFWTREPDDSCLYVTVGPLPPNTPALKYLTSILILPLGALHTSPKEDGKNGRQTRRSSRKRAKCLHS
jgi:hypothetical protein